MWCGCGCGVVVVWLWVPKREIPALIRAAKKAKKGKLEKVVCL